MKSFAAAVIGVYLLVAALWIGGLALLVWLAATIVKAVFA